MVDVENFVEEYGVRRGPSVKRILREYLSHYFERRDSRFWRREVGVYHASDTGRCLRKLYYEYTVGPREREEAYPSFYLGNAIEWLLEKALVHHYGSERVKNSVFIELPLDGFKVVGQTDLVIFAPNARPEHLFEVKSTGDIEHRRGGPSPHHVMQVHPYMAGLKLDRCTLVYVQRSDLAIITHEVEFDRGTLERGIERIRALHAALKRRSPPAPEPFSGWECRYCPYSECPAHPKNTEGEKIEPIP